MTTFDYLIVGQGLAGTALAWQLTWRHKSVLVLDRAQPSSASRVAAGLVTPITGQRLTPVWRYSEFWATAVEFYRRVEQQTSTRFFEERPARRIFRSQLERRRYEESQHDFQTQRIQVVGPLNDHTAFFAPYGSFEMAPAGRLNTRSYLAASRDHLAACDRYRQVHLDLQHDIQIGREWLLLPRLGIRARHVVFCQGICGTANPWFRGIGFEPAKGEILEVRIPDLHLQQTIHQQTWLAPHSQNRYLFGATYDRMFANTVVTPASRVALSKQLHQLIRRPFDVIDQRAGVRPAVVGRHPILGRHRDHPNLAFFNGLGSKGVLQSPYLAWHLCQVLENAIQPESSVDLARRTS